MRFLPLCTAGSLAIASASLLSAQAATLRPGVRVRVVFDGDSLRPTSYLAGALAGRRGDTVFLSNGGKLLSPVLLRDGRRLELSLGRAGRHTKRWATIGALLGAVAGGAIADATYQPPPCNPNPNGGWGGCWDLFGNVPRVARGAFLGLVAGALVGVSIGKSRGTERWTSAPAGDVGMRRSRNGAPVLAWHVSF